MKQTIRLRESELRHMIAESVRRVLNGLNESPLSLTSLSRSLTNQMSDRRTALDNAVEEYNNLVRGVYDKNERVMIYNRVARKYNVSDSWFLPRITI